MVTGHDNHPPKFSVEPGNQGGASLTNEDQAVCPDDYTLQGWQKVILLGGNLVFLWI